MSMFGNEILPGAVSCVVRSPRGVDGKNRGLEASGPPCLRSSTIDEGRGSVKWDVDVVVVVEIEARTG